MAGFNFEAGRSNNMVEAESNGKITIGRWAKRHKVSARAAEEVMRPSEAHHTGTGRRGKSRLTPVIDSEIEPTMEQLELMQAWDDGFRPVVQGWFTAWEKRYDGPYGRKRNVPVVGIFRGDLADAPKGLIELDDEAFASAKSFEGKDLKAYATRFDEIRE